MSLGVNERRRSDVTISDGLNEEQARAVAATHGSVVILAGAG